MNRARRRLMEQVQQEQQDTKIVPLNEFFGLPDFELSLPYFSVWYSNTYGYYQLVESTWTDAWTNSSNWYYLYFGGADHGGGMHTDEVVTWKYYVLEDGKWTHRITSTEPRRGVSTGSNVKMMLTTIQWRHSTGAIGNPVNFSWDYEILYNDESYSGSILCDRTKPQNAQSRKWRYFEDYKGYSTSLLFEIKAEATALPFAEDTTKAYPYIQCRRIANTTKLNYANVSYSNGTRAKANEDGSITPQTLKAISNINVYSTHTNTYADMLDANIEMKAFLCDITYTISHFRMWRWR